GHPQVLIIARAEIAATGRWLAGSLERQPGTAPRLLTLTGPGGVGKTRLALQVLSAVAPAYPGGRWLVELAALSDPALLPRVVASVLGVREERGRAVEEQIAARLSAENPPAGWALLVLDNCEHLVDACAKLVSTLIRACPSLQVLATSRETLRLPGEQVWPVAPLSLPDLPALGQSVAPRPDSAVSGGAG